MKAQYRCKQHSQGDHCQLELGHASDHLGQFTRWNGQTRTELDKRRAPKRDRAINRFVSSVTRSKANYTAEDRNKFLGFLNHSIKYLRGER